MSPRSNMARWGQVDLSRGSRSRGAGRGALSAEPWLLAVTGGEDLNLVTPHEWRHRVATQRVPREGLPAPRCALCTGSRDGTRTLAQRRPGVGQDVDVRLAQPLLLERLERPVLLELADLAVHVLEERGVCLADHGAVVGFRAEAGQDLEQVRALLAEHLARAPALHDSVEPLPQHALGR